MTDENDGGKKKGDGAAVIYVETVNGYVGPNITLLASDLKAYTTAQSDAKFGQIASKTQRGQVIVGAGLTVDAQGVIGTNSSAPDWSAITNKPTEYPPTKAGTTVLGGVKVGQGLQITPDGTLYSSTAAPDLSNITNKPAAYPPTIASATQVGGVKQGSGIFIDPNTGTINATGSKPTWDSIEDKPVVFPPPVASATVLGGVKEGNNVEIAADGTISSYTEWDEILHKPAEFPPTVASASVRGGIYVGNGLEANESGVLSLSLAQPNEIGGIIPGNTLATDAQSGRIDVVPASKENFGAVKIGDTLYIDDQGDLQANPGAISPATDTTLGGIKVGHGLKITEDGVLSNGAVNFVNRQEFKGGLLNDNEYTWELPAGVDYFRVTCIGGGGVGGKQPNDGTKPGGGGGGGGAIIQMLFFGYKYAPGTKFHIVASSGNLANDTKTDHLSSFGLEGGRKYFVAHGGDAGQSFDDNDAKINGFCKGGVGGAIDTGGVDLSSMKYLNLMTGTRGEIGFSANMVSVNSNRSIGGKGGDCFPYGAATLSQSTGLGYGGGGHGGGDNGGAGTNASVRGRPGCVIVEW